jgi:predicted Zn-dependent protease with MMP-like domain
MITLDEMEKMLEEVAETFPPELYKELNGGIILLPEIKLNPNGQDQDLYILGEYHFDHTFGRFITIYYGSMAKIHGHLSSDQMMDTLKATLKHEFRHHLENLAGERALEVEDEQYIEAYLKRKFQ